MPPPTPDVMMDPGLRAVLADAAARRARVQARTAQRRAAREAQQHAVLVDLVGVVRDLYRLIATHHPGPGPIPSKEDPR